MNKEQTELLKRIAIAKRAASISILSKTFDSYYKSIDFEKRLYFAKYLLEAVEVLSELLEDPDRYIIEDYTFSEKICDFLQDYIREFNQSQISNLEK